MEILIMSKTQKALDSLPEAVKTVLRKSLTIAILELKHDTEEDHSALIYDMKYLQEKLG
jgi:hypothetical protein